MQVRSALLFIVSLFSSFVNFAQSYNYSYQPKVYAVVIGINDYSDINFPDLKFPEKDAKAFYDFLRSPEFASVSGDNIALLTGSQATKSNIFQEIKNKFIRATKEDLIIFYFSGHGIPGYDNRGYFLTQDSEFDNEPGTAISMPELNGMIERFSAKIKISFVDACHSGLFNSINKGVKTYDNARTAQAYLDTISKSVSGSIRFLASTGFQESKEDLRLGHGVFTYFLLKGLKGEADFSQRGSITYKDGSVNIGELTQYLMDSIPQFTKYSQTPSIFNSLSDDFPLSIFGRHNTINYQNLHPILESENTVVIADGIDLNNGYIIKVVPNTHDTLWNIIRKIDSKLITPMPLDCDRCYFDRGKNMIKCIILQYNKPNTVKYYTLDGKYANPN